MPAPAPQPDRPVPPGLPELPVTFRPTRTRAVLLSIGAALLAVFTAIALLLPSTGKTGWGPGDRLTFIGSGLLIFGVLALLSRPKVVADPEGVTVVNLTTKRRLEWAEVLRVNLRPGDPWVHLDLADGTSLAAMGIQPGVAKARAVEDARALRALVDHYGTG
ncbi:PH domain-containing protein [Streptomyces sp. URMC 123]|uniref:PH domain-containing protein n=1 Tax=Streptomyces sp. URMC 123 TaxID=3423403 RepID=UPI003F1AC4B3